MRGRCRLIQVAANLAMEGVDVSFVVSVLSSQPACGTARGVTFPILLGEQQPLGWCTEGPPSPRLILPLLAPDSPGVLESTGEREDGIKNGVLRVTYRPTIKG